MAINGKYDRFHALELLLLVCSNQELTAILSQLEPSKFWCHSCRAFSQSHGIDPAREIRLILIGLIIWDGCMNKTTYTEHFPSSQANSKHEIISLSSTIMSTQAD